jgi:hypothetical protein
MRRPNDGIRIAENNFVVALTGATLLHADAPVARHVVFPPPIVFSMEVQ